MSAAKSARSFTLPAMNVHRAMPAGFSASVLKPHAVAFIRW
jgi:hypothetical protein